MQPYSGLLLKRFVVFIYRFAGPVDIEYRMEVEKFTDAKIVRIFFKGAPSEDDFFIERVSPSSTEYSAMHQSNSLCEGLLHDSPSIRNRVNRE